MIYLFDDTNEMYIQKFFQPLEFTDVLVYKSCVSGREVRLMEPSLSNAEWIFIHKSFKDSEGGPREVYDYIVNDIADYGDEIPLILFSDEDRPTPIIDKESKNLIESYKKSVFYSRLASFLENRRISGMANIELLLYGVGGEIEKIINAGIKLLTAVRTKGETEKLSLADISVTDLMCLINSARPNIGIEYSVLMQRIETLSIRVGDYRSNIKAIIESFIEYGTNIYSWK